MLELASKIDLKSSSSRKKEFAQLILQRSASQKAWDFNPEMNETSWQTAI